MRYFTLLAMFVFIASQNYSQTVDGQFSTNIVGNTYQVTIQANMQSGTGSASIVAIDFTFNNLGLSIPNSLVENVDYIVQGDFFNYPTKNILKVGPNKVSVNILAFTPTPVSLSTTPKAIILLNFTIIDGGQSSMLTWTKTEITPSFIAPVYTIGNWPNLFNDPLPVELSSFTSKFLNDKIQLNWGTKTEVNNYGFNVERRINEGDWKSIGFVEGHGNSNSPKNYSFTDNDLFAGGSKFVYRLKQIDNDGQFEYSDVVEVEIMPTEFELSQNYPNPFNPSTTIRFSLPTETRLKINIYNMLGEMVQSLAEGSYEAGYHKVTFNASSLPSGAYIYRIESSEFVQVRKMILIK